MKLVYSIDSNFNDKAELGNKGANLVNITNLGLPVPSRLRGFYWCL